MKQKNIILKLLGITLLLIGIYLNIMMFVNEAWPTYVFLIFCFVGILQILVAHLAKPIRVIWQILLGLLPFAIGLIIFRS